MKRVYYILCIYLTATSSIAQSPQKFIYQAVIRNASNIPIINSTVGMHISILQGSVAGTVSYSETQTPITNSSGLVSLEIGAGTVVTGTFASIDWANDPFYLKAEIDPLGGTNYIITSVTKILSVPYTLYAKSAKNIINLISPVNSQDVATKGYVDALGSQLQVLEDNLNAFGAFNVTDIDGNEYGVVKIGTQRWMTENLKTRRYNDGTPIPFVTGSSAPTTPAYFWYGDTSSKSNIYGALYNWYAVDALSNGGKNVCPTGWHVPSDSEWNILTDFLGGLSEAGGKLKEVGSTRWTSPNTGATDEVGFTALPCGKRNNNSAFSSIGNFVWWWATNGNDASTAWTRSVGYNTSTIGVNPESKVFGFSVRCLRD